MIGPLLLVAALLMQQQPIEQVVPPSPVPGGFIADPADVLGEGPRARLNGRIGEIQAAGYGDIAVAILPSLGGYEPFEVGVAIYRAWKVGSIAEIGSARRDVGALLLIVPKELAPDGNGHCWITTGSGAEGIITDLASGSICRDHVIPRLRERDHAGAVAAGVEALAAELRSDEGLAAAAAGSDERRERKRGPLLVLAVVGGLITSALATVGAVFGIRRRRRNRPRSCPGCGGTMQRLDETADDAHLDRGQRTEERVKSVDYDVWECGRCGTHGTEAYGRWWSSYKRCTACGAKTAKTARTVLRAATTASSGLARDVTTCEACGEQLETEVVLPKVTASSSGGSGSSGRSGGSSFGGSGRTGGGGGGGRY